jgi:hypothetical protein
LGAVLLSSFCAPASRWEPDGCYSGDPALGWASEALERLGGAEIPLLISCGAKFDWRQMKEDES